MKIILASHNPGKIKEFNNAFKNINLISASTLNIGDVPETGLTYVENAIIKARHCAKHCNHPCIADDSGLEVDALGLEPGVFSARYAGEEKNNQNNINKMLTQLQGISKDQRTARFRCVLVFMRNAQDPSPIITEGTWNGFILEQPYGEHGFGYDPIFWSPENKCSAAEITPEEKSRISHRAQAISLMAERLNLD
ncbi:MAG TPA: RdgB/HAM1 family non-canonical purine NTP pyrophosphatase [Gammaproteobacteria bacterium]|nr:RdgB/HAM1 family non-canonical purine NTP pyrophosphatase [Gammaproteobacteria bacterium]